MVAHKQRIEQLLKAYQSLDSNAMAACYHEDATFSDIAFRLKNRNEIRSMWHMICTKGIDVKVDCVQADKDSVRAKIIVTYTFSDTGRTVVNKIDSTFQFREGLIISHRDNCDALDWGRQAFGGFKGEIVGRFGVLRRMAARKKLRAFIASDPETS